MPGSTARHRSAARAPAPATWHALILIAVTIGLASSVRADGASVTAEASTTATAAAAAAAQGSTAAADGSSAPAGEPATPADPPRRPVPDYDSREEPGTDAADVLLWVPRILTGPLYLVSEYVIRIPVGAAVTELDRSGIIEDVANFFVFGPHDRITLVPTAFYDFGFLPSIGVFGIYRDVLSPGDRWTMNAATWGPDWLSLTSRLALHVAPQTLIVLSGGYLHRPDFVLETTEFDGEATGRARYAATRGVGELGLETHPDTRSFASGSVRIESASFEDSNFGGDQSVSERAQQTGEPLPFGYATGYTLVFLRTSAAVDTRGSDLAPSAGVRLFGYGDYVTAVGGLENTRWVRVGGQALAATDLLGARRVLSLAIDAADIVPVVGEEVPFDQTVDLGGLGPLPGFLPGALRGMSALALTLGYEWPIWVFLDSRLYLAVGNAFDRDFQDFALDRLRFSFGVSFQAPDPIVHPFEVGLGFGTDTFSDGTSISSFRFYAGVRRDL